MIRGIKADLQIILESNHFKKKKKKDSNQLSLSIPPKK